ATTPDATAAQAAPRSLFPGPWASLPALSESVMLCSRAYPVPRRWGPAFLERWAETCAGGIFCADRSPDASLTAADDETWPSFAHPWEWSYRGHPSLSLRPAKDGGGGGIRTHEALADPPVFKTGAFNRSATPPKPKKHDSRFKKQAKRGTTEGTTTGRRGAVIAEGSQGQGYRSRAGWSRDDCGLTTGRRPR